MSRYEMVAELQTELFHFWNSDYGRQYSRTFFEDRMQKGEISPLINRSHEIEALKMAAAEPIYIAPEIQEIIEHAAESFQPEPLLPSDLVTTHGFALFPRPFIFTDIYGKKVTWRALAWYPAQTSDKSHSGIVFSLYSHKDDDELEDYESWYVPGKNIPSLTLLHIENWWFNEEVPQSAHDMRLPKRDGIDPDTVYGTYMEMYRGIQTFFRLSMQQISERDQVQAPRATRRRMQRAKLPEKYITVIRLRRPRSQKEGEPSPVNWSHRWIVHGFWRKQWFPSLDAHRQIYINSYIKGPAEKPLIIRKGRAFEFVR